MPNYVTVEGDTFDMLALKFYSNEKLASVIIQANPDYCDTLIFEAGIPLVIPDVIEATLPGSLPPWRRNV